MANSKMTDFRKKRDFTKKDVKEAAANYELLSQRIETLTTLVFGLSKRVYEMDRRLRDVGRDANAAQWRSQSLVEVLSEATPTVIIDGKPQAMKTALANKAEDLQIADFNASAAEFDKANKLVVVDGAAEAGHFATVSIDYFKDGAKLEEQRTVRSKIHLGQHELFPELDDHIKGMKVGETKKFPLSLMGLTDEAELHLFDLKKPQPKEEPTHEPVKTEG
jgi:hypothetical protein